MKKSSVQLIIALDVDTFDQARKLVDELSEVVDIFKVGSQLFTACGPVAVRYILAKGKKVFLDLKYHDIPNTVANAVSAAVDLGILPHEAVDKKKQPLKSPGQLFMLTVHALGGKEMMQRAVEAAAKKAQGIGIKRPLIIGITVLTSQGNEDNISRTVLDRARLAKESGLDGVVASSQEAALIRREFGKDFVIVTPGIRPQGEAKGDQKRVSTPAEAIKNGSDYLVVGRPIVAAPSPLEAVKKILREIKGS